MVDLHCHILPGVDDGAADLATALEMARVLSGVGFTGVATSPHMGVGPGGDVAPALAAERRAELREALGANGIALELLPNGEHYLSAELFERVSRGEVVTVGGDSRWLLVELPWGGLADTEGVIFRLQTKGYRVLLAHPERNTFLGLDVLARLVDRGVRTQVELGSFLGAFGAAEQDRAWALLDRHLVHVLATDLHRPARAAEWLPKAFAAVADHSSTDAVQLAAAVNPRRMLADEGADAIVAM